MKRMIFRGAFRWVLLVVFFESLTTLGQVPTGGANSAMIRLFGDSLSFTAKADIQVYNTNRVVWLRMPSQFSGAETKLRVDVDLGQIQSKLVAPSVLAHFKQIGTDRISSVIRPDKKAIYIIYPGAQSYANIPLSGEDAQIAGQKVEKKPLGKETIDGHACVKNFSTVKSAKGTVLIQAVTWNATDLKDFPVQIQTQENGNITLMRFQQVSLAKPAPAVFELPAGFKQYSNPQDLAAAAEKKGAVRAKK
jgi:hypothetical protein